MKEITFNSSLSDSEIEANFKEIDLFSGIMAGLEEALAYEKGKAKAATLARKASLPEVNVANVRHGLNMTQKSFASVIGVSPRTVEAWETGRTNPSPTALNLMFLLNQDHSLVDKLQIRMKPDN